MTLLIMLSLGLTTYAKEGSGKEKSEKCEKGKCKKGEGKRAEMREKMKNMSEEEREAFRTERKSKKGGKKKE